LIKRIFRLYPLWLVTLTTFAALALLWRAPTGTETVGYFLYSGSLLPTEHFPFYDIGWSLQHEMVFYLTAALLTPVFGLYGLVVFLVASTIAFHTVAMPWYFSNLAMFHPEFLAGVLAFIVRQKFSKLGFWLPLAIGIASLYCFIALWGGRSYVPIALFFLILGFANIRDCNHRWLTQVESIGDASYSIYLIHPLVFLVASGLVSKVTLPIWSQEPIRAMCFVVIIATSLLSWRYFERPMMQCGWRLSEAMSTRGASWKPPAMRAEL
jgi:peptidoglycan/LPS O-acetylase OafA/YrhL